MKRAAPAYAIKVALADSSARHFAFPRQKTMYGGKRIAVGDTIFIFASENEGGTGLVAVGTVTAARAVPRRPGVERQTPRVSIEVRRTALARRPLGRKALSRFSIWHDGRPETELNFKFYRQATNKIVGLSAKAAGFLRGHFTSPRHTAPVSVDDYIRSFPPKIRSILAKIRNAVREAAPEATERISYRMPALFQHGVLVYYAAFKQHVGLYPPVGDAALRRRLAKYSGPKGNLQFPLDEPIPYALIQQVVRARLRANQERPTIRRTR